MITMLILVVFCGIIINLSNNNPYSGLTLFEDDNKCINAKQIQIMQTLEPNMALAHAKSKPNAIYDENEVLFISLPTQ